MRRQEGQVIPALVMVMLSLIALGMLFFQVGRAAIFSTEAQTAADAAALAAVKNVQAQLTGMVARSGTSDLGLIDSAAVRAAAERYASTNGAHVVRLERNGVDVRVWVSTEKTLGDGAKALGKEDTRGEARARARLELEVIPGSGSLGPSVSGGDPDDLRPGVGPAEEADRLAAVVHRRQERSRAAGRAPAQARVLGRRERRPGRQPGSRSALGDAATTTAATTRRRSTSITTRATRAPRSMRWSTRCTGSATGRSGARPATSTTSTSTSRPPARSAPASGRAAPSAGSRRRCSTPS